MCLDSQVGNISATHGDMSKMCKKRVAGSSLCFHGNLLPPDKDESGSSSVSRVIYRIHDPAICVTEEPPPNNRRKVEEGEYRSIGAVWGEGVKGCGRRMAGGGRGKERGKAGALGLGAENRRSFGTRVESRTVSLSGRTHEKQRKEDERIKET
ncbi:hypothetical protein EYF80_003753 [Liparis tanakae]|uniref:Uncharacterized protein n=1 Tax=Liparis tanakae TaxID=230148 RepID=A0A4Z2J6U2_9TELE|nr:hypothetical protein EYF80_003753 [Liparis tanakae]